MMFILTLKDKPEGVFSIIDTDCGDQIIPIFECEDDAERYQELLGVKSKRYRLQVVEIPEEVIVTACEERDQKYAIITQDDFIIPPEDIG
jgi:hypothetical protein